MAKISKKMAKAINEQIIAELESAYIYLNIANYYVENGLAGFGAWFKKQAEEEVEHAEKFIDYLHSNGEKVVLTEIAAPKDKFKVYLPVKFSLLTILISNLTCPSLISGLFFNSIADL